MRVKSSMRVFRRTLATGARSKPPCALTANPTKKLFRWQSSSRPTWRSWACAGATRWILPFLDRRSIACFSWVPAQYWRFRGDRLLRQRAIVPNRALLEAYQFLWLIRLLEARREGGNGPRNADHTQTCAAAQLLNFLFCPE